MTRPSKPHTISHFKYSPSLGRGLRPPNSGQGRYIRVSTLYTRGVTLIELLVSISILAAMTVLVSALWTQVRSWSTDADPLQKVIHQDQVLNLLQQQWSNRRSLTNEKGRRIESISMTPTTLEFITARPILFPDAPLVQCTYEIQTQPGFYEPNQRPTKLVYTESPINDLAHVTSTQTSEKTDLRLTDPPTQSLTLLNNTTALHWQQRMNSLDRDSNNADPSDFTELWQSPPEVSQIKTSLPPSDLKAQPSSPEPSPTLPPAIRLRGFYERQPFECILVVAVLR